MIMNDAQITIEYRNTLQKQNRASTGQVKNVGIQQPRSVIVYVLTQIKLLGMGYVCITKELLSPPLQDQPQIPTINEKLEI